MEAYPEEYVEHNRPLVLLSGLGEDPENGPGSNDRSGSYLREGGFRLQSGVPPVTGSTADSLIKAFEALDAGEPSSGFYNSSGRIASGAFKIRRVGRTYTLPPRKAPPPPQSPFTGPMSTSNGPIPLTLHSTISPLTPSSPCFPDGIMTPVWITKHQTRLPSAFVAFFPLTSDPNTSSLRDNQLKSEINALRGVLTSTNYKTRLIVMFMCEDGEETPYDLEERLGLIRRAAGLDVKTSFYVEPEHTAVQLEEFARTLLGTLQPACVEYYRDLSKHARRKRNRGSPPQPTAPPTSGSQPLSQHGWNVRYEFKLGILAEFRQEMDAACRNFESAYEGLFSQELFESIPSWSPRFNDARLLADVTAIRIIRCLLWTGQTTTAVRSWNNHRDRIRDLVSRRGKGTNVYGWEAWEALWSKTMAQLVERAGIAALSPGEQSDLQARRTGSIFCFPEKSIPIGERISPWEHLHHQGYWLNKSQQHAVKRRELAVQMPEEDRSPPGQSPASVIASKAHLYDTYLAPAPYDEFPIGSKANGFDHMKLIVDTINTSIGHYTKHRQFRAIERISLQLAGSLMAAERWADALQVLEPVWKSLSWRRGGWWALVDNLGWTIYTCAQHCHDTGMALRVLWELHSDNFQPRSDFTYDLKGNVESFERGEGKAAIVLRTEESSSPILPAFTFSTSDGNVGENLDAQLVLYSAAHPHSAPINLSEVKIVFEGSLRPIRLLADDSDATGEEGQLVSKPRLRESTLSADLSGAQSPTGGLVSLVGKANLSMAAGSTKAFDLSMIPREAGEVQVASISVLIDDEQFSLASVTSGGYTASSEQLYLKDDRMLSRPVGQDRDVTQVTILPKPPKLEMSVKNLRSTYYTNEEPRLELEFKNDEDDDADVSVDVLVRSTSGTDVMITWHDTPDEGVTFSHEADIVAIHSVALPTRSLGVFEWGSSRSLSLALTKTDTPAQYEMIVTARYHLVSDRDTPMTKELVFSTPFMRPFEANYEFLPRFDAKPWPNLFEMPDDETLAQNREEISGKRPIPEGLSQRFSLNSKVVSFAKEVLIIEQIDLLVADVTGGADCAVSAEDTDIASVGPISPDELQERAFNILVSKYALADRRQVGLDFTLSIKWRRDDESGSSDAAITAATLATPRYAVPMAEPRVLLTKSSTTELPDGIPGTTKLHYMLENPSLHFLTFSLTMESSEDLAFSGPKTMSMSLVPMSRHSVDFTMLATKRDVNAASRDKNNGGGIWLRPNLVVVDQGFRKRLTVIAAGEGVKQDKKGVMVWVE